jgi:uncharacterized protein YndB with AHSA1/START domain
MQAMSAARREAFIDAPVQVVWDLISDVERHPEWWPRVIEVQCDDFEQGCTYRQLTKVPFGHDEMKLHVEQLDDCQNLSIRCLNTGSYVHFLLTEAQGGTFVDTEIGMEPQRLRTKFFDAVAGRRYFTAWLAQTIEALDRAARERARSAA